MTKSEKNVLADVVGMLNTLISGNSDGNQTTQPAEREAENHADEEPSEEEVDFVKGIKGDGDMVFIKGFAFRPDKEEIHAIRIGSNCFGRMLDAYLEKYDHE